jgi:hypothetical protein
MIDKVELSAKVEHPFIEGIAVMGKAIIVFAAIAIQLLIPAAGSPAAAVSADLANRCRTMAIKSHPPVPGKAYAQAERDFFAIALQEMAARKTAPRYKLPLSHRIRSSTKPSLGDR